MPFVDQDEHCDKVVPSLRWLECGQPFSYLSRMSSESWVGYCKPVESRRLDWN
jgi:hypothetical protein